MLALTLTADMNGVTDLSPVDSEDEPYFFSFKVQCTSCREVHLNWISVSRFESNDVSGSRGDANFVWKCKNCKRESRATIIAAPTPYQHTSPPTKQKVIEFDCRGLEFTEFKADVWDLLHEHKRYANANYQGEWKAKGLESTTVFSGIDLQEGEWFDYDEKAGEEVSIKELKWEIQRA